MAKKYFCYVDETGQDTQGDLFVVSVIVAGDEREQLIQACEAIEQETGKGRVKWIKTAYHRRLAYIQEIIRNPLFLQKLTFAIYRDTKDYVSLTVQTVALTLRTIGETDYKATIFIDGLSRTQERRIGSQLRHMKIRVRKVRGVKEDENDALIRLADAVCGFVRAAFEGQPAMRTLLEETLQKGALKDLFRE